MTKEEAIKKLFSGDLYDDKGYVALDGYTALETIEGVELKEKTRGTWSRKPSKYVIWQCSNCKNLADNWTNYCPCCGAEMSSGG